MECREMETEGRQLRCRYSVLVDTIPAGRFFCECYGVKIEEEETGDEAVFPGLTCSVAEIDLLMERLVRCRVTPTGLADILCDWKKKE